MGTKISEPSLTLKTGTRWRSGLQEEHGREGTVGDGVETWCYENFLQSMRVILARTSRNGEY